MPRLSPKEPKAGREGEPATQTKKEVPMRQKEDSEREVSWKLRGW